MTTKRRALHARIPTFIGTLKLLHASNAMECVVQTSYLASPAKTSIHIRMFTTTRLLIAAMNRQTLLLRLAVSCA